MNIPIIFLLPHKDHVIVRHRAAAIVGEAHGVDSISPVQPGASAGDFGVGVYALTALRLAGVGELKGKGERNRTAEKESNSTEKKSGFR